MFQHFEKLIIKLKEYSKEIGFDRLGVTHCKTLPDFGRYESWIQKGYAADMWYLTEPSRVEKRKNIEKILPGAKSVIVGAISYAPKNNDHSTDAKFGRYAWGKDYHLVVQKKLKQLAQWLTEHVKEPFSYVTYVDTGPILERSLAERAGVGWIGKNTCVMHETTGSYLYLGEIITTLSLPEDSPAINRCGTCTRCLDACPTGALVGPYQLDSNQCISYHTIESRAVNIPDSIAKRLNGWVAGCDICQEVCPWNQEPLVLRLQELSPLLHTRLSLQEALALDEITHKNLFQKTSLKRVKWPQFLRVVKTALTFKNQLDIAKPSLDNALRQHDRAQKPI